MELFFIFIGVAVVGGVITSLVFNNKADKFVGMGDITGKSPDDIIAVVGSPSSISNIGPDQVLYQWIETSSAGGYHYAIQFNDGKCIGYTHQHRS